MIGSNIKPTKCCDFGTYKCQVSLPINSRIHGIDYCIHDIISALNAANIKTIASCCGHNKVDAIISLEDGRELTISKKKVVRFWQNNEKNQTKH